MMDCCWMCHGNCNEGESCLFLDLQNSIIDTFAKRFSNISPSVTAMIWVSEIANSFRNNDKPIDELIKLFTELLTKADKELNSKEEDE